MPLPKELEAEKNPPVRLTQDALDRYLARGELTGRCAEAAVRARALFERLHRQPDLIGAYGGRLHTASCRGNAAPHGPAEGVHRAAQSWQSLAQRLGPILSAILTAVICEGGSARDWAVRGQRHPASGIEILRIALHACADHWGLPSDAVS
ncbi:hypothetical protein VZ95_12535 [Elstera litoralis]|uniref:Uncharacterized protein n=2 Tax=Elstera litoralis TaxID=552518 RepID=A0A0F3IUJ4_9PROT|nr:hypothetical protein VZ95_12535 [Elstera litoralis]